MHTYISAASMKHTWAPPLTQVEQYGALNTEIWSTECYNYSKIYLTARVFLVLSSLLILFLFRGFPYILVGGLVPYKQFPRIISSFQEDVYKPTYQLCKLLPVRVSACWSAFVTPWNTTVWGDMELWTQWFNSQNSNWFCLQQIVSGDTLIFTFFKWCTWVLIASQ